MGFLKSLLPYKKICIQCHDNPDADSLASAFGVYSYLKFMGRDAFIIYGGEDIIKKSSLLLMINECQIPIEHTNLPEKSDLLLLVDCQYKSGNTQLFHADNVAVIDHHPAFGKQDALCKIDAQCQSCSTLVWEMLLEEGYELDEKLSCALLFGLYTDTSLFSDLFARRDTEMKMSLYSHQPLFEKLAKSNMTLAELMVASEAISNHMLNIKYRFAIVHAISCEQSLLGTIGDFMLQADIILLTFTYTDSNNGYRISIRSCDENLHANEIAEFLCRDVGNGGGHLGKAGGFINGESFAKIYGDAEPSEIIEDLLIRYIDENKIKIPPLY